MGKIVEKAKNKAKQIDSKMQEMEKSYLNNRCDLSKQQKQIIQEKGHKNIKSKRKDWQLLL